MKRTKSLLIISCLLALVFSANSISAQEFQELNKDSISNLVKQYYELNKQVFAANSTVPDIDRIFDLFTDDFTYIHPKYGGTYSRETLYNGYVRNQKNGAYDGKIVDIKITNIIVGLNAIVVEKKFVKKTADGTLEEGAAEMTLFEFRENKIAKIFEYW